MFDKHLNHCVFDDPAIAELLLKMPALAIEFAQLEFVPRRGWYQRDAPQECDTDGEHTRKLIWAIRQLPREKMDADVNLR